MKMAFCYVEIWPTAQRFALQDLPQIMELLFSASKVGSGIYGKLMVVQWIL
jgi:hypothetical protein